MKNAPGLARTVGPQAPQLLQLVAEPPLGSEPLLLHMLLVLTGARAASEAGFFIALGRRPMGVPAALVTYHHEGCISTSTPPCCVLQSAP